jgi:hypothetical protein
MNQIQVLIAVDVEAALATGNLQGNVYLVDNNGPQGSTMEGNPELNTACNPGQIINWWVSGIDPSTEVSISSFTGVAVPTVINPVQGANGAFSAPVDQDTAGGTYQYSVNLNMDGKIMPFDPFLIVS